MLEISDQEFHFIRKLVYEKSRINLGDEKKQLVCARLSRRLHTLGLHSFSKYLQRLTSSVAEEEITELIDAISTNYTQFFREMDHFEFLQNKAISKFIKEDRTHTSTFKIWSAACSSGEEPYSLAIWLSELFHPPYEKCWQILATDISRRILQTAEQGIYEASRIKLPNPDWLRKYFQRGTGDWENSYRVKKSLRERIAFKPINLTEQGSVQPNTFDVILCRNVMIYFDQGTMEKLINNLHTQLKVGGHLIIGHAENLHNKPQGLEQVQSSIFQKK